MSFASSQIQHAEQQQLSAAQDTSPQVRLLAGPGTGKSKTIEKRILHVLSVGVAPRRVYVVSFTRAACDELKARIANTLSGTQFAGIVGQIKISTMHALALRTLRQGNLLNRYPSTPIILDSWEELNVFDSEFADSIGCSPTRAAEIRLAYDTMWQTLQPTTYLNLAQVTPQEIRGFNAFHATRTNLYCCILPGEVIHRCVLALQSGTLQANQLPQIEHLIVDEFQDLNACDQEFIKLLTQQGAKLFVAGDDDQSIYSFRHANPNGIAQFQIAYPNSSSHILTDCFRCTPSILIPASQLISFNPNPNPKNLVSLYSNSTPPVQGQMHVWTFATPQDEAKAVATSCQELINNGMLGREDEIFIIIANRRVQLGLLIQELTNLGLQYDPPRRKTYVDEYEPLRAIYSILRLMRDYATGEEDYPAHRDLLNLLEGVGSSTAKAISEACINNLHNYRNLFYLTTNPTWLNNRSLKAVGRVTTIAQAAQSWLLTDTIAQRTTDIQNILTSQVYTSLTAKTNATNLWSAIISSLQPQMTLDELLQFLAADTEADQQKILDLVDQRLGITLTNAPTIQKRIRILTMHGAKGLNGKVVFIPSAEQGIVPHFKALRATGLLIEQRRLFYVSVTRTMACCILSHTTTRRGAEARPIRNNRVEQLPRSQFIDEMGIRSINRISGLSSVEASAIVTDVNNL